MSSIPTTLDARARDLAQRYLPLAIDLLKEVIRIPADHVDRPAAEGGDPLCGLSNHEGPRLEYLRRRIVELGAVDSERAEGSVRSPGTAPPALAPWPPSGSIAPDPLLPEER